MKRYRVIVDGVELDAADDRQEGARLYAAAVQSDDNWLWDIRLLDTATNAMILHAPSELGAFGG